MSHRAIQAAPSICADGQILRDSTSDFDAAADPAYP